MIISSNELVWKGGDNKYDFSLNIKSLNEGHDEGIIEKPKELTMGETYSYNTMDVRKETHHVLSKPHAEVYMTKGLSVFLGLIR